MTTYDEEIADLEKQVNDLEALLTSAIGKQAEAGGEGDSFARVAADIRKRDSCSGTVALQRARAEAPDQFRQYQMAGIEIAKAAQPYGK